MGADSTILWGLVTVAAIAVIITVLSTYFFFKERKQKSITGRTALEGETGVARTDINPEGRVLVHGEWWNAKADEHLPAGTKVKVVAVGKMMLKVERAPEE